MKITAITSSDNAQYKHLKKLASSARERRKSRQTILDGVHLLKALGDTHGKIWGHPSKKTLGDTHEMLEMLVVRDDSLESEEIRECLAQFSDVKMFSLSKALFNVISPVETPVGVLGLMRVPEFDNFKDTHCKFGVMLENIQDPGNLGSILRTAAAAGVEAVYLSKGCAEAWSPKALRAGMGAQFLIPVYESCNLAKVSNNFDKVLATELRAGSSIYDAELGGSLAFIFGNEGAGLSEESRQFATDHIKIPMPGNMESLNVAAAVAVCLFERVRQITIVLKG